MIIDNLIIGTSFWWLTWLMAWQQISAHLGNFVQICVFLFTAKFKGIAFRWHAEGEQLKSPDVSSLYIILDTTTWDRKWIKHVWPILTKKVKTIQKPKDPKSVNGSKSSGHFKQWPNGLCHHRSNGRAHPWACMHWIDLSGVMMHHGSHTVISCGIFVEGWRQWRLSRKL